MGCSTNITSPHSSGKSLSELKVRTGFVRYPSFISIPRNSIEDEDVEIVDCDASISGPVVYRVLQSFGIPIITNIPLSAAADLPGYDVKDLNALDVIKLSLDTQFVNNRIVEVYIDGNGMAYFIEVGQVPFSDVNSIRYSIPTTTRNSPVSAVFVHGLKPPIRRELRQAIEGFPNKEIIDWAECKEENTCRDKNYTNFAAIMYDEPILNSTYHDGIRGAYEKKDWEQIVGFVVDLDLPKKEDYTDLKITFSKDTIRYPTKGIVVNEGATVDAFLYEDCKEPTVNKQGIPFVYRVGPFQSESIYDNAGNKYTNSSVSSAGGAFYISAPGSNPNKVSDFISVDEVYIVGHKIIEVKDQRALSAWGWSWSTMSGYVEESKHIYSLEYGKHWLWDAQGEAGANIYIIYEDKYDLEPVYNSTRPYWNAGSYSGPLVNGGIGVPGIGDPMGYLVMDFCFIVSRKKSGITVTTTDGNALEALNEICLDYIPIVIVDRPAAWAYAYTNSQGQVESGLIDQSETVFDTDPTTVQTWEEVRTKADEIQENSNGTIVEMSVPFVREQDVEAIALNVYNASIDSEIETRSYILGPDAQPDLGQVLGEGVINEINYSYSDSSSYLITVNTGPKYMALSNGAGGSTVLRTEDVTLNGKVVKDMGDGTTYTVKVERGFGETPALSTILERIEVGDTVSVTIYNVPVEKV
mgnify:CR=1 FL=1